MQENFTELEIKVKKLANEDYIELEECIMIFVDLKSIQDSTF